MNWLLRHNFWMVKLLGLVVTMALLANTTTTLVALYLLSDRQPSERLAVLAADEDEDETEPGSPESYRERFYAQRAREAEQRAERILGPSVFCPTCSPAPPDGEPGPIESVPDPGAQARRSQLPLVIAATMEHADPSLSVATLIDTQRGVGGLFGVGDVIGGQVEIVHVATGMVHINNNGVLEYIPFGALPAAAPPAAAEPTATPKPAPRRSSRAIEGAEEAIQCTDKGDCVVDRAFVEKLIADPKLLMGQGRMSPTTTKDGAPGFRVRGVGKGTLPQLLGLQNGDVITEIGGSPLTMEAAMSLYGKLRHASHVEVTVDRRGQRMQRQLDIRS